MPTISIQSWNDYFQNIQKFRLSFQSFIIKSMVLQRYVLKFLLVCRLLCFSISKTNRFFSKQPVLERDHKLQNRSRFLSNLFFFKGSGNKDEENPLI